MPLNQPNMPPSTGPGPGGMPAAAQAPEPPPSGSGMMTPQKPAGAIEGAKVQVLLASKVLTKALSDLGIHTPEGKAVLDALKPLGKVFGKTEDKAEELMPAEIKQLMQGIAGPGKAPGPPGAGGPPGMGAPPPMPPPNQGMQPGMM